MAGAICVATLAILVSGCAETKLLSHATKEATRASPPTPAPKAAGPYKIGNPYQVAGVWYYPKEDLNYDETGIASWYGPDFHGKATANGEIYDMNDLTAAHKTLPLPTYVRVTNLENGRSIVVRVNDRGPFVNGRIIDMTRRGSQLLGFDRQGTARVRVQVIGPQTGDTQLASRIPDEHAPPVTAAPRGPVTAEVLPPPPGVRQQQVPRQSVPIAPATATASVEPLPVPTSAVPDLTQQTVRVQPVKSTSIYVQAGAFTRYDNAYRLGALLSTYGTTNVSSAIVNGSEFFRVRVGPLPSVEQADQTLAQMIAGGHPEARIVVD